MQRANITNGFICFRNCCVTEWVLCRAVQPSEELYRASTKSGITQDGTTELGIALSMIAVVVTKLGANMKLHD